MKILIVYNEKESINIIKCLSNFEKCRKINLEIDNLNTIPELFSVLYKYDVIIIDLDIDKFGIDFAYNIRTYDKYVKIIFISSNKEYCIMGYKASANLYLLKPITQKVIDGEMGKIVYGELYQNKGIYNPKLYNKKIFFMILFI